VPAAWSFDRVDRAGAVAAAGPKRPPAPFLPGPLPPATADLVLLSDLVTFVQHPVKAFLRERLGLGLRSDDGRPADALDIDLDGLARWGVGERILAALLDGGDLDSACAAEAARGLLPPGVLGERVLAEVRGKAAAVAEAALHAASGPRSSVEVDVDLADGRRIVGTVSDIVGDVLRAASVSKLAPKHRLAAWVRFLGASGTHAGRPLQSATVGWGRGEADVVRYGALAGTAEGRGAQARRFLALIVDLYDRGMREPLPLWCETSHRYASARRAGNDDPLDDAARYWTSSFDWAKEDKDPEHLLVLGGQLTFGDATAAVPAADEAGDGWDMTEDTRFGRLARRLWDPILAAGAAAR
jgi:exodeoxyribonuclease V gamma subunit